MTTSYETDIAAWANEQAALLRNGQLSALDIEHIAEEIEDVGKSQQRELASRMAVLVAHLLKWQYQPSMRSKSWERTIVEQRRLSARRLKMTPSLSPMLADPEWMDDIWVDATGYASKETGLDKSLFPETCPWAMSDVLAEGWLPS